MSAADFGAPAYLEGSFDLPILPLIAAAVKLGPLRMKWCGNPPSGGGGLAAGSSPTCWSLDGKPWATFREITNAARIIISRDGRISL